MVFCNLIQLGSPQAVEAGIANMRAPRLFVLLAQQDDNYGCSHVRALWVKTLILDNCLVCLSDGFFKHLLGSDLAIPMR